MTFCRSTDSSVNPFRAVSHCLCSGPKVQLHERELCEMMNDVVKKFTLRSFYVLNAVYFYVYVVYPIAKNVATKCGAYSQCIRRYTPAYSYYTPQSNYFISLLSEYLGPYRVDLADGQWREFRSSLLLLWAVMIGIVI